jgi:CDP-diacylglycerol--glycerol-3-phosphate 3-phosphatidyltransferase
MKRPPIVNLPNVLTTGRFVLALVLFGLIEFRHALPDVWLWCLGVFVAAAITDYFDGYFARRLGLTSTLGRNLDPVVDKVLMCGAFLYLIPVENAGLAAWMVVIVVARELIITSLRGFLESQGISFGADWLGKVKMVLQCAALIAIFVALQVRVWTGPGELSERATSLVALVTAAQTGLIWGMVAATALSGLQYLWKATALLKSD